MRGTRCTPARTGRMAAVLAPAAALLAATLAADHAAGQFATVLNLPPNTIADGTTIGSDTQVNLLNGGQLGSNIRFGHPDATSTNVELNVNGGTATDITLNPGATANLSAGLIDTLTFNGDALNISGGEVNTLKIGTGAGTINLTGGLITDLNFQDTTSFNQTINISGGELRSNADIGFDGSTRISIDSTVNISGGRVKTSTPARLLRAKNIYVTGGDVNASLLVFGGKGEVRDTDIDGRVSATLAGSTLDVHNSSSKGISVYYGARVTLFGGTHTDSANITQGGAIHIDGAEVNVSRFYAERESIITGSPTTLTISSGTLTATSITISEYLSRDDDAVQITGGTVKAREVNIGNGSFRMTGGVLQKFSINSPIGIVARQVSILGGEIGDNATFRKAGGINSSIELLGGRIGNNALFFGNPSGSPLLIAGTSIGNGSRCNLPVVIESGSIGDHAVFLDDVTLSGGTIGEFATFTSQGTVVDIRGRHFEIDGVEISRDMLLGEIRTIEVRDVVLSGTLLDNSHFEFFLNTDYELRNTTDYFSEQVKIQITYVPEPGGAALLLAGGFMINRRRRAP